MSLCRRTVPALVPLVLTAALSAQARISNGSFEVTLNELGVLEEVPAAGLATLDGPSAELGEGFAEWFGIQFMGRSGFMEAVGSGLLPDWAKRREVTPVSFHSTDESAVSVVRIGPLEIETTFEFDEKGPYLLGSARLTNRGTHTLIKPFYTREWLQPGSEGWSFPSDLVLARPPAEGVCRLIWMFDDILPGKSAGARFAYRPRGGELTSGVEVPLTLFMNADWPGGVPVGETNGLSFGDYDADGFIDMFALQSARLWRNVDGLTWVLAADLDSVLPPAARRYGSSFGDYNNDGLPDIACAPREGFGGDECFHLLKNLGGGPNFVDVATDPTILDVQPCDADAETICWGDVDDDGDLDVFLPVYPEWAAGHGPGNFFLQNTGLSGGEYRFMESVQQAGLDNVPPGSARPEGAQFVDVDFDGDIDLYSNGHLYQNVSVSGPDFDAMAETASGIGLSTSLDEGAMLFDYDMDGDYDLVIVYTFNGVRIWESYGDGNFFAAEQGIIDSPCIGLNLGISAEDWDNDGDIDFTTRQVFRRNMLVEQGMRHFTVASTAIPAAHITSATPSWGDWDKDGDLDCALGNWLSTGHFYENTAAGVDTSYVRVRVVRDSNDYDPGLETEYGANVEIRLAGETGAVKRRKFVASSHGYLNQNEYTLHFALPSGANVFDVVVDFPTRADRGLWRVDEHVNPLLGDIDLATLTDREIVVYRSGRVIRDGIDARPNAPRSAVRLTTTTGGLALPDANNALTAPVQAPVSSTYVGLELHTMGANDLLLAKEIVLDGQLGTPVDCGSGDRNVALWDVTQPLSPSLVAELEGTTSDRNRRSYVPCEIVLYPDRTYRLVALVDELRATPISGPVTTGPVTTTGGLAFQDLNPCSGAGVAGATVDPTAVYAAIRFAPIRKKIREAEGSILTAPPRTVPGG